LTVRRLKTYASDTGCVYEYYFVGQRPALESFGLAATEYVYDVGNDRRSMFAVSIFLLDSAAADWAARHGRALDERERYVAARLALQRAFDEIEDMFQSGRQLRIDSEHLEKLLAALNL
jgi:hypothetical protein